MAKRISMDGTPYGCLQMYKSQTRSIIKILFVCGYSFVRNILVSCLKEMW